MSIAARRTAARATGAKPSWRVLWHAPHEIHKNIMKIVVLFHLNCFRPVTHPIIGLLIIIVMQSWPVMESQSQQCLTTSQDFFIMLIHKSLLVHRVAGCCLFTHT